MLRAGLGDGSPFSEAAFILEAESQSNVRMGVMHQQDRVTGTLGKSGREDL